MAETPHNDYEQLASEELAKAAEAKDITVKRKHLDRAARYAARGELLARGELPS